MRKTTRFSLVAATACLAAVAEPAVADATPGSGVSAVTIYDKVVGDTDYVLKEITIQPGGGTGWHYHPGPVYGFVKQGVLTHNEADCSVDGVYHRGQVIQEDSGAGYIHIGRNLGSGVVVLEVFYQSPVGEPLAVDAPNPGCSFE